VITEYEAEPIPGLPGLPPKGEKVLWQGSPDWRVLARTAFHTRTVAIYFGVLVALALVNLVRTGSTTGVIITGCMGVFVYALLNAIAWGTARSTIYTLTDRRIVLRIGMALPKCINLPLSLVGSVGLNRHADGSGDLPVKLTARQPLGYVVLWPHARPWQLKEPEPMLRAVPEVDRVAALIARACLAAHPSGNIVPIESATRAQPAYGKAVAA
jgi:hypothetical protein